MNFSKIKEIGNSKTLSKTRYASSLLEMEKKYKAIGGVYLFQNWK